MATSPLPPRGPKRGRKCDVTSAFSGVPNKGEGNQKWLPHPCLLGGPKEGGNATSPVHSRGSPTKGKKIKSGYLTLAFSGAPMRAEMPRKAYVLKDPQPSGQNGKWLPHPCLLGGPKEGGNATSPLHSRGSPPRGGKSKVATSPLPSRVPKRGRKCYITPAFSGVPNKGEQNEKWLPHPCLLGGPKEGGNATSPLNSRGTPTKGNKIRYGCLTLAFSGGPKEGGNAT